jgi:hypothetical protein
MDLLTTYTRLGTTSTYSATANLRKSQITAAAKPFSSLLSSRAVPWQRLLYSGDSSPSRSQVISSQPPVQISSQLQWVRVRVTLQLAAYRQSVRLGDNPFETHNQYFFSQLNTCGYRPYTTSSLTRGWVCRL